nr:MAG TPA: DNA-directed RNA polymerase II subunit [Caudoviricetes sp.]
MAEYIDREEYCEKHCRCSNEYCDKESCPIWKAPAADVAPVVHGKWLRVDDDWNSLTTIQCPICSEEWCFETDDDVSLLNYKYCPNCGAKMDGGNEGE